MTLAGDVVDVREVRERSRVEARTLATGRVVWTVNVVVGDDRRGPAPRRRSGEGNARLRKREDMTTQQRRDVRYPAFTADVRTHRRQVPHMNDGSSPQPSWTEWITRPQGRFELPEFTLVCVHGSATSEVMKERVPVEYTIDLLRKLRRQHPDVPTPDLILGEVRLLMGWVLSATFQCECGAPTTLGRRA